MSLKLTSNSIARQECKHTALNFNLDFTRSLNISFIVKFLEKNKEILSVTNTRECLFIEEINTCLAYEESSPVSKVAPSNRRVRNLLESRTLMLSRLPRCTHFTPSSNQFF